MDALNSIFRIFNLIAGFTGPNVAFTWLAVVLCVFASVLVFSSRPIRRA